MGASTQKGNTSCLSRATYSDMSSATALTIMCWINSDTAFSVSYAPYIVGTALAGPMHMTCDNYRFGAVMKDGAGSVYGHADTTDQSLRFSTGIWYHLSVTWSANNNVKCYIDGTLVTSSTWLGSTPASVTSSSVTLFVGGLKNSTDTKYNITGKLAYSRIFTRELSVSEILECKNKSSSTIKNCVSWWDLIGESGNLIIDQSGNARTLTNNSSVGSSSLEGPPVFMDNGLVM